MEHRWGQRRNVHQRVHLRTAGGLSATGHIVSLSISGALVKTALPAAPLAVILIGLLPDKTRSRVTSTSFLEAQVVRRTDEGIAVEWCESAPEFTRVLGEIASQQDQPSPTQFGHRRG